MKKYYKKTLEVVGELLAIFLDRKLAVDYKRLLERKILISDCEKIENYIFKTPLIKGLSKLGYHITVMGSSVTKKILKEDRYIDEIIITNCYRKKSSDIFKKIYIAFKYRKEFSHYVDTTGSSYIREILFMRILSPCSVIGTKRKKRNLQLMCASVEPGNHYIDTSLKILGIFGK